MTNSSPHTHRPTNKQLRYLRDLARSRGQTFTMPHTRQEASDEIERLRQVPPLSPAERRGETFRNDIADRWGPATAVRPEEIEGYGSTARWRRGKGPK
jgi:hypothetical protein